MIRSYLRCEKCVTNTLFSLLTTWSGSFVTLEKSNDRQVGNTFATQLDVLPGNSHSFRLAASRNVKRNRH